MDTSFSSPHQTHSTSCHHVRGAQRKGKDDRQNTPTLEKHQRNVVPTLQISGSHMNIQMLIAAKYDSLHIEQS
jgi:hypothetical protein